MITIDRHGFVSPADTARLVRAALARELPGVRFYVRTNSYSGGASIRVSYDGSAEGAPSRGRVSDVVGSFTGSGFDGMIDMKYGIDRYLTADGRVVGTETHGTYGSAGLNPPVHDKPPAGARLVRFLADYVFVEDHLPYDVRNPR